MRRNKFLRVLKFALFAVLFVALVSLVVLNLWNWLAPALFGWHRVTFWQALGVLILSRILFGGFRGGPARHWYGRRRMMERWDRMTPEERETFRQAMRGRCSPFRSDASEAKS